MESRYQRVSNLSETVPTAPAIANVFLIPTSDSGHPRDSARHLDDLVAHAHPTPSAPDATNAQLHESMTVREIVASCAASEDEQLGSVDRGLRISEALSLPESDLDRGRGAVLVRRGKGSSKRREVGMDRWAGGQLLPWREVRAGDDLTATWELHSVR
jgi:hypothetical protein